jgi:hypothetical protein
MGAVSSSETTVTIYHTIQCDIPEAIFIKDILKETQLLQHLLISKENIKKACHKAG